MSKCGALDMGSAIRCGEAAVEGKYVIAGLDPAIHLLRKESPFEEGWVRGSSPRTTLLLLPRASRCAPARRYARARRFRQPNIAGSCCAAYARRPRARARRGSGCRRSAPAFAAPAPARPRRRWTRSATARFHSELTKAPDFPAREQRTHGSLAPPDQRPLERSGNIENEKPPACGTVGGGG